VIEAKATDGARDAEITFDQYTRDRAETARWTLEASEVRLIAITVPEGDESISLSARAITSDGKEASAGRLALRLVGDPPPYCEIRTEADRLALSILCTGEGEKKFELTVDISAFPFRHRPGETEDPVFEHLRNNARYLASRGLLEFLRMPALFLRGLVLNFLILLPYLMLAAVLAVMWSNRDIQAAREATVFSMPVPPIEAKSKPAEFSGLGPRRIALDIDGELVRLSAQNDGKGQNGGSGATFQFLRIYRLPSTVTPEVVYRSTTADGCPVVRTDQLPETLLEHQPDRSWLFQKYCVGGAAGIVLVASSAQTTTFDVEVAAWKSPPITHRGAMIDPVTYLYRLPLRFDLTIGIGILLICLMAAYPVVQWVRSGTGAASWRARDAGTRWLLAAPLAVMIGMAVIEFQPYAI
jgi:hypothetical protein